MTKIFSEAFSGMQPTPEKKSFTSGNILWWKIIYSEMNGA